MSSLFRELKRRNVVKVAVAYIVVGWILIEASSVLMPAFGAPDWVFRIFALLIVLGFPLALVFAWAFEMTSEGLKRTEDVPIDQSVTGQTGQKLNYTIIGLLVVALGISISLHLRKDDSAETSATADAGAGGAKTIAVLPFVNMSADPENEYFSDGIAEELLNVLVKVEGLEVSSRTSSFAFKGKDTSIPEIADQLGVDHVLEGSVRKAGNTVRITAQLIDVKSDKHLWSDSYDRELADIFAIQEEIATSIVNALKVALGAIEQESMARAQNPTDDIEAYELYLQGRFLWQQRGVDNIRRSIKLFENAIDRDPTFAKAYSNLAAAHAVSISNKAAELSMEIVIGLTEEAAGKATELDNTLAEPHAALGLMHMHRFQWLEAEKEYRRAIELEPREAAPQFWLGILYTQSGRVKEAIPQIEKARQLEPTSALMTGWLSWAYFMTGNSHDSNRYASRANELDAISGSLGAFSLAQNHTRAGNLEEAAKAWVAFYESAQLSASHMDIYIAALEDPARKTEAIATMRELESQNPDYALFWEYRELGELELSFDAFERAIIENPAWLGFLWAPGSEEIRQHPRFRDIVERLKFVKYWRASGWPDLCRPDGDDDFECD